jgi:hypothetical protein
MKKSFLKKLAFVMAFATVSTSLAPAAGVLAASTPSLSAKSKTLLLNDEDRTEYDFNIKNKVKGSTYKWTTSDKKVATVNAKTGLVEAQKTGTVKITCKITLPTKKTKTLTATVTVKENIDTLTIDNPTKEAIAVGASYNFNYDYTTVTGGKTTDKVRFEVTKGADKASIKTNGVFTATEAGEYEVVALAFQSEAKYKEYLAGNTDVVTAKSAPVTVKVVNKIAEFKAVKSNTLKVTFASTISEAKTSDYVLTDVKTSAKVYIKSATLSADKKSVDLELYSALTSGNTYALVANVDKTEMKAEVNFVKGTVAKIEAASQIILAGSPASIVYTVYDENGLDITADTRVAFESTIAFDSNNKLSLGNGVIAYVTIVYTNVTNGQQIRSSQFVVTGSNSVANAINAYTVVSTLSDVNWNSTNATIALGSTKYMYVQTIDQYNVKATATNGSQVTFESLDPSIAVVDKVTGKVTAVKEGTALVKITSGSISKIVTIVVQATAKAANIDAPTLVSGSMTGAGLNNPGVWMPIKDQYNNNFGPNTVKFEVVEGAGVLTEFATANATQIYTRAYDNCWYGFTAAKAGTTVLKVTSGDLTAKYITVVVTENDPVQTGFVLGDVKDLNIDKHYNASASGDKDTTVKVYAVNKNGEKVVAASGSDISIKVTKPDGSTTTAVTGGSLYLSVASAPISHTTGTYTVVAYQNGVAIATKTFVVSDSASAPAVTLKSNTITGGNASLAGFQNIVSVPTGYTVIDVEYVSGDSSQLSDKVFGTAAADVVGTGVLYNVKVQVKGADNRIYTVALNSNVTIAN